MQHEAGNTRGGGGEGGGKGGKTCEERRAGRKEEVKTPARG